jgi:hypothetical protein
MTISLKTLREKRDQLMAGLAQIGDLRRGSLAGRFRKCGKPNCHCAQEGSPGHGPSYSLTHKTGGKTVTTLSNSNTPRSSGRSVPLSLVTQSIPSSSFFNHSHCDTFSP